MLDGGGRVAEGAQPDQVTGRLRIADYMTPQDNLYFEPETGPSLQLLNYLIIWLFN